MRRSVLSNFCLLLAVSLIVLTGYGGASSAPSPVEIRVGLLFPLTGAFGFLGTEQHRGAKMALDMVNAKGGVLGTKIQMITADSKSDPQIAASETQRLIDQNQVPIILGSYASALSTSASTIAERNRVVFWEVGAVANELTQRGYKYFFRSVGNATTYAEADVDFLSRVVAPALKKPLQAIRVAVVHENGPFGTSVADSLVKLLDKQGIKPVSRESYPANATDLTSLVLKLKAARPDVVFLTPLVADALLFWQTAQDQDFNVPVLVGSAGISSPAFQERFGNRGVEGVFDVEPPSAAGLNPRGLDPSVAEALRSFLVTYAKEYNRAALIHAGLGFNGAWIVATDVLPRAVRASGGKLTPDVIRQAASATDINDKDSILGYGVKFAPNGDDERGKAFIMQWRNGNLVVVWPEALARMTPVVPMPTWDQRR